ncbi:MAG: penicillin-binding protein 2 [Synergistales bacterium]|nr:penicillin-binding protein 2 [Synergistales bacterium]
MARAESQYWQRVVASEGRGRIADRKGIPLAISVPTVSVFLDPQQWDVGNAKQLGDLFPSSVVKKAGQEYEGRFRWLVRKQPPSVRRELEKLNLPGIYTVKEKKRVYPQGSLLAHVLGFCDIDDIGLAGLERFWNRFLYSDPSVHIVAQTGSAKHVDVLSSLATPDCRGGNVVRVTIDARIQHILERCLDEAARNHDAQWAVALCMNPESGEVLGMVSWPTFDPNRRETMHPQRVLRNNAVGRIYEPGSALKPIVMGIALEQDYVEEGEVFHCPGRIRIADGWISEIYNQSHGKSTLEEIIVQSSNVGMAKIGLRFQAQDVYDALRLWGFDRETGIGVPGEEKGMLYKPGRWVGVIPANIAIGQGIAVTPLQLTTAISAIANGGHLLRPYLVDSVLDAEGEKLYVGRRTERARVLCADTAQWLQGAMRQVVALGTGQRADVEGLEIAGKTGTSQVALRGEYKEDRYVATFVGFWPQHHPEYVMLVSIGEPEGEAYTGGRVAAPVFRKMAELISRAGL